MKKRAVLSVLMVLSMVLLLSVPAFAADSGSCGENATWKLKNGVLIISGSGMVTSAPWSDQLSKIEKVNIEQGILSICDNAFAGCTTLEVVVFADGFQTIGKKAFANCNPLLLCFYGNPPRIASDSFQNTLVHAFHPSGNTAWDHPSKDFGKLAHFMPLDFENMYSCGENLTWRLDGSTLTLSGSGAMENFSSLQWAPWRIYSSEITKVVLPEGLTTISFGAFGYMKNLKEIKLPNSLKEIKNQAFTDCESLTSITIPNGITKIYDLTFRNCYSLKEVVIPSSVTSISDQAFMNCTSLKKVVIPDGLEWIHMQVFQNCTSLTEIHFQGDAPIILDDAFDGVTATAYYPADNATWTADKMQDYCGKITWKASCSHTEVTDPAVAPSCTSSGLTEGKHCAKCDAVLTAQQTVPATGHNFGAWTQTKAPTTTQTGIEERKCANCSAVEQQDIPMLEEDTPPTETEPTETDPVETDPVETDPPATQPSAGNAETQPTQPAATPTEAPTQPTTEPVDDAPTNKTPWGVIVVCIVGVLAIGGAAFFLIRKRKH